MRLTPQQQAIIKRTAREFLGAQAQVWLFGSRVDDAARGGDIDLLIEAPHVVEEPTWLIAQMAGRLSRLLDGQKVDVVLWAPNIQRLPIHAVARQTGIVL